MNDEDSIDIFNLHSEVPADRGADDSFDGSSRLVLGSAAGRRADSVWNYISERYGPRLYLVAELALGPKLRARYTVDDLLQETMLKTYKTIDAFEWRSNGSFYRWLCTNVRRTAMDWARRMETRKGADAGADFVEGESSPISRAPDAAEGPTTVANSIDLIQRIRSTLEDDRMPGIYREVLIPLIVEGRDSVEVAEERGVSPDVLRKQKNRGLKIWRGLLEEQGLDPDSIL